MNARAAIGRVKAMDPAERRFRLACEARKIAGRARCAIRPPAWNRAGLVDLLVADAGDAVSAAQGAARQADYLEAHRQLARHFRQRASRWPVSACARDTLPITIASRFPHAAESARREADTILSGVHDLLGYRDVPIGNPPDWHLDPIHRRRAALTYWASLPYLDPALGDHKIIWETNRHQYWLTLGAAYWLTGDARYRATFVEHLEDWLRANPPLRGVNWASMLELAFRTLSWTWAIEFFCHDADDDETPWLVDLLVALDRQLTHVVQNLSRYFSPNTHLSGEALALYAVSTALPELRRSQDRAALGRAVLLRETAAQVHADGGHAELSAHYHRYSTDFYLLALMTARAAGDPAAAVFAQSAHHQAAYLRTIADDRGELPLIGDDDGGRLFRFGSRPAYDAAPSLAAAADLFRDPALAVGAPDADVYWILGRRPEIAAPAIGPVAWPSRVLAETGYVVSRSRNGGHMVFDAGRHGFLNGGHAHSDALSIVLSVAGEPLLVDPGTATYTMDAATRDRFRSSRMHNTVILGGRDHAQPAGPFHWHTRPHATLLVARLTEECDFAVGSHDAYGPRRHVRAVLAIHGLGWLIVDRVATDTFVEADAWWHLHPAWNAVLIGEIVDLRSASGLRLGFASTAAVSLTRDPDVASVSLEYGRIEPATTIRTHAASAAPLVMGAFIPAAAGLSTPLSIRLLREASVNDREWTQLTFCVSAGPRRFEVSVDLPADPQARPSPESWPQPCIAQAARNEIAACVE
jgi:hypothetical protein